MELTKFKIFKIVKFLIRIHSLLYDNSTFTNTYIIQWYISDEQITLQLEKYFANVEVKQDQIASHYI